MNFIDTPSPFFDERPEGTVPSLIVLHFTGGQSFDYALETLTKGRNGRQVSAHYLIHEDGRIFRLVDEKKRAWHAGVGQWNDEHDINNVSIGIELSNRDRKPYPAAQLAALADLVHDIRKRYDIPPANVIGHSDLAPARKDDPGYHFPWNDMAKEGVGAMPHVKLRDRFRAAAAADDPDRLRKLLVKAGYSLTGNSLAQLIGAFQQHYTPAVYTAPKDGETPGVATAAMVAKLRAAARQNSRHSQKHGR